MRLAYLIIAHQQPEQLAQMLYCIQHPDNVYLVMPDSKGLTGSEPALQAVVRRHPNVFIAPARDMRWASWSLMQARLDGIRELLARPEPWEVLINLSGQDFPLKSQEEIRAFFAANEGRNFLDIVEPEKVWNDPYARIQRIRLEPPFMKSGWNVPKLRIDRWSRHLGQARYPQLLSAPHRIQPPAPLGEDPEAWLPPRRGAAAQLHHELSPCRHGGKPPAA